MRYQGAAHVGGVGHRGSTCELLAYRNSFPTQEEAHSNVGRVAGAHPGVPASMPMSWCRLLGAAVQNGTCRHAGAPKACVPRGRSKGQPGFGYKRSKPCRRQWSKEVSGTRSREGGRGGQRGTPLLLLAAAASCCRLGGAGCAGWGGASSGLRSRPKLHVALKLCLAVAACGHAGRQAGEQCKSPTCQRQRSGAHASSRVPPPPQPHDPPTDLHV